MKQKYLKFTYEKEKKLCFFYKIKRTKGVFHIGVQFEALFYSLFSFFLLFLFRY